MFDIHGFVWTVLTIVGYISMIFSIHIHVPLKMNHKYFGDPLSFKLSNTLVCE